MKMFQYWHTPTPPEDVAAWVAAFRTMNPAIEHRLFDRAEGERWLERHCGAAAVANFRSCAVPAMQADYLRVCLVDHHGGLYLDADRQPLEPLDGLLADGGDAPLLVWLGLINNDLLLFRKSGHPFIRAVGAVMADNIGHRRFDAVPLATGPAIFNAVRYVIDPSIRELTDTVVSQGPWPEWGWATLLARVEEIVAVDDVLLGAYQAIAHRPLEWSTRWADIATPVYKREGGRWGAWEGSIYR